MKRVLEIVSYLALVALAAAPAMFYAGKMDLGQTKLWMLLATIVWFAAASCWIGTRKKDVSQ